MTDFESRRQQLDLVRLHTECERNYRRLYQLFPDNDLADAQVTLQYRDKSGAGMALNVLDVLSTVAQYKLLLIAPGPYGCQRLPSRYAFTEMPRWLR